MNSFRSEETINTMKRTLVRLVVDSPATATDCCSQLLCALLVIHKSIAKISEQLFRLIQKTIQGALRADIAHQILIADEAQLETQRETALPA
jgi:hypothetical protein